MAKRKPMKKRAKKAAAKKKAAPRKKAAARKKAAPRKKAAAKKKSARRAPARKAASRKPAAPISRIGLVTHTELASTDPGATRTWCADVLGWKFGDAMPTPAGPYHMWRSQNDTGGGIRANNPPEVPGSIPYVEVADIHATYAKAIAAGGTEMLPPDQLPGGMGWIAIVAAPGGCAIGFWAM